MVKSISEALDMWGAKYASGVLQGMEIKMIYKLLICQKHKHTRAVDWEKIDSSFFRKMGIVWL